MICWGCGSIGHGWKECATPRQSDNLPFKPETSSPLPHQPGRSHHIRQLREVEGAYGTDLPQS